MPSTATDRLSGLSTSVAVKAPCRVATTANITLSGLQTIDGIALADGDRVLVKDQTNTVENGIYVARSSAWERAKDFNGNRDAVRGTLVLVQPATDRSMEWVLTTANPVVIGTSAIVFEVTPVQEKLSRIISAIDKGASPTASAATNTTAIQAAIDEVYAAGGGVVLLDEPGDYAVSASTSSEQFWYASTSAKETASDVACIIIRSGVLLKGLGRATSITGQDRTKTVIVCVSMDGGGVNDLYVRNLWNPGDSGAGHGIFLGIADLDDANKNLSFERLEISNCGSYGIGAQWGNYKSNRYDKIYVHDVGADGIDHKVRGGTVSATSRGVSFSNILCELYGQRAGIVNSAGMDIRGPATITNYMARNFGAAGGTNVGIRFSAGVYDSGGADTREPSSFSSITNFYIESDHTQNTSGVVLLSSEGTTVANGTIIDCNTYGVSVENSSSGYGVSRDTRIESVLVDGVRAGAAFRSASGAELVGFVNCISRGAYDEFSSQQGNLEAGQTVFAVSYDAGTVQVYKNGALLAGGGVDYTASNGTSVTLTVAALVTDVIGVVTPNATGWNISGNNNQITACTATYTTTPETVSGGASPSLRRFGNYFGYDGIRSIETSTNPRLESYGSDTNIDFRVDAKGTGGFEARSNGGRALRAVNSSASAVNWVQARGAATTNPVDLSAQGSDADIDLTLTPKGAGLVRFGTKTATGDVACDGYISIKDAAGNTVKLMTTA